MWGKSNPPNVTALPPALKLDTPCKVPLTVPIPVTNWLKEVQRFNVKIEMAAEDEKEATFLRGANTMMVPGASTRKYKLTFHPWTVGDTRATITFTNPKSGEYLFYQVAMKSTPAGETGTIKLECMCRQSTKHLITVENPLAAEREVELPAEWWKCDSPNVRLKESSPLTGNTEGTFELEYRPLVVTAEGEPEKAKLDLDLGPSLGNYHYNLELVATPAGTEQSLNFKVALGAAQRKTFRFRSFSRAGLSYKCEVEKPLFFEVKSDCAVDGAGDNWDGVGGSVDVVFEPEELGKVRDMLVVRSDTGGEFKCMLEGECTPPLPRGPFEMMPGGSTQVSFKNVFNEEHTFLLSVDNPVFSVDKAEAKIARKSEATFKVSCAGSAPVADGAAISGKLRITCPEIAGMPPWIIYLSCSKDGTGGLAASPKGKRGK